MMENNTIRVNALPTLTWHRLHVNACKTEPYTPVKPCTVQTVSENGVAAVSALEPCTDCSAVETGVGRNVDNLFQWGMTVTVPENGSDTLRMEIGSEDGGDCAAFVHVQAEAGSELTLVQIWKADASHAALRTVIRAEAGATVRLVQILADASAECINDVGCVTGEKASFEVIRLYLAQGNVISGIRTDLAGNGSSFTCKSGYLVKPAKKLDMNVIANHIGKNTQSDIQADGTLYDGAEKAFRGTIDLKRGCAGSEGKEEENVLLLGDDVVNKTIPLILCTEEDVKGSHGASIGELEQGMLFYFEARGISKSEAEKIVAKARLEKLCQETADEKAAEYMHQKIEEVI